MYSLLLKNLAIGTPHSFAIIASVSLLQNEGHLSFYVLH